MALHLEIDSAGTSDWHIGDPPYHPAIEAAARRGYDLSPLRRWQGVVRDFPGFALILAMDRANLGEPDHLRPKPAMATHRLCLDYARGGDQAEVPDPYYTRDFDGAIDLIEQASRGLIASL